MGNDYIIKNVDPGLWKDFKTACAHYGISMRRVLIKHMENISIDYKAQMSNTSKLNTSLNKKGDE